MAKTKSAGLQAMEAALHSTAPTQDAAPSPQVIVPNVEEKKTTYRIFRLVNPTGNKVHIASSEDVPNPENGGKIERLRLLRGHSSIWAKDQKELTPEYIQLNKVIITFNASGYVYIPEYEEHMIKRLELSCANIDNPLRVGHRRITWFEWNPEKMAEEQAGRNAQRRKALKEAMSIPDDKMRKHAIFLGINLVDELGLEKSDKRLRNEYEDFAEKNYELFLSSAESTDVDIYFKVMKAITDARIDISSEQGKAKWSASGQTICVIPHGVNAARYLTSFAKYKEKESIDFLDQLKSFV